MNLAIAGMSWVTPLGSSVSGVWQRLQYGERAEAEQISGQTGTAYQVFKVSPEANRPDAVHPRLRRASAISRFAVSAGIAALENAKWNCDQNGASRTALVFAISNGGVIYTRKFYNEIVQGGARAASPLLFPETVFNAPASHLAAILGIAGAAYTLVGDGAVGILALQMAQELMRDPRLDYCLVIGAEETDWLLCDAYRKWRLVRDSPPIEVFQQSPKGTILSEGAGALLLDRKSPIHIEKIVCGGNFMKRKEAPACVERVLAPFNPTESDLMFVSANGTFVDAVEQLATLRFCRDARLFAIKEALGESVGAGALWQTICGAQSLLTRSVPEAFLYSAASGRRVTVPSGESDFERAIVSVCGLNQQVAGLALRRNRSHRKVSHFD